jgi:hypothetical protein
MSTDDAIRGETVTDEDITTDDDTASAPETYFHKVAGPTRSYAYPADGTDLDGAADEKPMAGDPAVTDPDLPPVATGYTGTADYTASADAPGVEAPSVDNAATDADLDDADLDDPDLDNADLDDVPVMADAGGDDMTDTDLAETTPPVAGSPAPIADSTPSDNGRITAPVSSTSESLLGDTSGLTERWRQAAAEFVDDPRAAASHAADVAADAVTMLETALRERRVAWDSNGNGDTEALRQAVLGYRRILDKLLS